MKKGTVKFFNYTKGFGFIKDDETGREIFVHQSGIGNLRIEEGDKVSFELGENEKKPDKGPVAINVKKI